MKKTLQTLLIEDNPGDARLIREMLSEVGPEAFELQTAETLSEGFRCIAENSIDLTLLDLTLPDSRGLETLEKVRSEFPTIPVVVLTGLDDEEIGMKAVQGGAQDYLVKGKVDAHMLVRSARYAVQRMRMEMELRQKELQLTHVARLSAMGEMVAGIAHEINQPLYSILNYSKACSKAIATESQPNLDSLHEWIDEIETTATRAGEIIKRLKDFVSKKDRQRFAEDIQKLMSESIEIVGFEARQHQVLVKLESSEPLPVVRVDRVQIQQVMVNLLRNAYEALGSQSPGSRRVSIRISEENDFVIVAVADTGPGLHLDDELKLFDAFVSTKPDGMGMGLAISKTIVESHGGKLWTTSNAEGGATFFYSIPIERGAETADD